MTRLALLLVGSPKKVSTSEALGAYLLAQLAARGWETRKQHLHRAIRKAERWAALLHDVAEAELVVLATPLYADALPSGVTEALERLAQVTSPKPQRFVAISNSGFPEAAQSALALAICRQFAREVGSSWLGGLALGGGPAIEGRDLVQLGGMTRNIRRALDLAAAALDDGQPIPERAVTLMAKPLVPKWAYLLLSSWGWRRQARQYGAQRRLRDRPYAPIAHRERSWLMRQKTPYLRWFTIRVAIPISWFASSVFITRPTVSSHLIEFALGALVLLVYAVLIDWPARAQQLGR